VCVVMRVCVWSRGCVCVVTRVCVWSRGCVYVERANLFACRRVVYDEFQDLEHDIDKSRLTHAREHYSEMVLLRAQRNREAEFAVLELAAEQRMYRLQRRSLMQPSGVCFVLV